MGMEIKNLLTDGEINLYFGAIDTLTDDNHKDAYISASIFSMTLLKDLFGENIFFPKDLKIPSKHCIYIGDTPHIDTKYFFRNLKEIFEDMYNLDTCEVILFSDKLNINIYCDPVDIQIYYGDNCKPKNTNWFTRFLSLVPRHRDIEA